MIRDYLSKFSNHYKLLRHFNDEPFLEWCAESLGKEYRDWSYYKGHKDDPHCAFHIKDPKKALIFEIKWAHIIIGRLDYSSERL
jgi:hypothetical protein